MKTLKNGYEIDDCSYLVFTLAIQKIMQMTPKEPKTVEEAKPGLIAFLAMHDLWKLTEDENHQFFNEETRKLMSDRHLVHKKSTGLGATFVSEDLKQIVSQRMKWEGLIPTFTNPLKEGSDDETSEVVAPRQP